MGQADPDLEALCASSTLQRWLAPDWLSPAAIDRVRTEASQRGDPRFVVLDEILRADCYAALADHHAGLDFEPTDLRKPYDSMLVGGRPDHFGGDLFFSSDWHAFLAALVVTPLDHPGTAQLMLRKHRLFANGLWPHTDRHVRAPVCVGMFLYLNPGWTKDDGGILQFWEVAERSITGANGVARWAEYPGRRLDFLEDGDEILVEAGNASNTLEVMRLAKTEEVLPLANRMVVSDFRNGPAYHSVTPGRARHRYDITLRLF